MASHFLFVDSSTAVGLDPEYSYESPAEKNQNRIRTTTGAEYVYTFAVYQTYDVPVMFVNCADMVQIYSWWAADTELYWLEPGGVAQSVRITNKSFPLSKRIKPYNNLFQGTIKLSSF